MGHLARSAPWFTALAALGVFVGPLAYHWQGSKAQLCVFPAVPVLVVVVASYFLLSRHGWVPVALALGSLAVAIGLLGLAGPQGVPLDQGQQFRADPEYGSVFVNHKTAGIEWYRLANHLVAFAPKMARQPGSLVFWYRNEPTVLNSVQATFVARATTLQAGNPGLPELSDYQVALLRGRTPRFVMMLAEVEADLEIGETKLRGTGVKVVGVRSMNWREGGSVLWARLVELSPSRCDRDWHDLSPWLSQAPCA